METWLGVDLSEDFLGPGLGRLNGILVTVVPNRWSFINGLELLSSVYLQRAGEEELGVDRLIHYD